MSNSMPHPPRRRPEKVTIKDVAHAAGVAWSTASYALNNGPKPVSEDVRRRVVEAARDLGYSSNLLARGLVTGRMHTIGVLVPELFSYNATEQVAGAEAEAQEHDYRVVLASHLSQPSLAEMAQRDMNARRLDGILSISATADVDFGTIAALPALGVPFVLTYHAPHEGLPADYAAVDQEQGGYLATCHLLALGRKRIAFVGPIPHRDAARRRFDGYRRAHSERGLPVAEDYVVSTLRYQAVHGTEAAKELWSRPGVAPDGVFAASDSLAGGVLRVAHARGLRVPEDLAVVGFDDLPVLCSSLDPPLTSVRAPLFEMGRWSVRRLVERLDNPDDWQPTARYFPCTLTVRESTG